MREEIATRVLVWLCVTGIQVLAQESGLSIGTPQLTTSTHCTQEVETCEPLKDGSKTKCFGTVLPYSHTSLALAADSYNQSDAFEKLFQWEGLRNVPKCWEVIQPFLCATYLPKCTTTKNGNDTIHTIALTGKELCERTREPCKIVESVRGWPEFLQCNSSHFPQQCKVSSNCIHCFCYKTLIDGLCTQLIIKNK
jgi:smoothened protein